MRRSGERCCCAARVRGGMPPAHSTCTLQPIYGISRLVWLKPTRPSSAGVILPADGHALPHRTAAAHRMCGVPGHHSNLLAAQLTRRARSCLNCHSPQKCLQLLPALQNNQSAVAGVRCSRCYGQGILPLLPRCPSAVPSSGCPSCCCSSCGCAPSCRTGCRPSACCCCCCCCCCW